MAETVGSENIEFIIDGVKYGADQIFLRDTNTEVIRVYVSDGTTRTLIWKRDDAVAFDYNTDTIVFENDNENMVWHLKVYRNYDESTQTGTDITSSLDNMDIWVYSLTIADDGTITATRIYNSNVPNDLIEYPNSVSLADILAYVGKDKGIYSLDVAHLTSRNGGTWVPKSGVKTAPWMYNTLELDEESKYVLIEYTPTEDVTVSSIGVAVDTSDNPGGASIGIMHESGLFSYLSGTTPSVIKGSKYCGTYYISTHTLTSTSLPKLKAGDKYYIWIKPCTWTDSKGEFTHNAHYFYQYDKTGNYKVLDKISTWQGVKDTYSWTYLHEQTVPYDNSWEYSNFFLYKGSANTYIDSVSIVPGTLYYVNRKVYSYGEVSVLPTGDIEEASICKYNGSWYCYYPDDGWKPYYQGSTYQPIKQCDTSRSTMADVETQTDRKYYLEINGVEV